MRDNRRPVVVVLAVSAQCARLGKKSMRIRISLLPATAIFAVAGLLGSTQTFAQNAYITNAHDDTVSLISSANNKVTATIPVGQFPFGVAVAPNGSKVYVTNQQSST